MKYMLALSLALATACGKRDMPDTREGIIRWARNCGNQLLVDARDWYDGLPADLTPEQLGVEVQAMFIDAGRFKTTKVVLDQFGVPVGVTWDQRFWDAADRVLTEEEVRTWKVWSASILNSGLISAGLYAPRDWRDAAAAPVVAAVSQTSGMGADAAVAALNRLVPLPWDGPCVEQLRTLMPEYPERRFFPKVP
ncbi:MAG: hypothetical protein QF561_06750 [Phycisphaerales bacterium]|jgi:hypothetical protein|nr:hypothetical protein [Phycisphaerales bacterium]